MANLNKKVFVHIQVAWRLCLAFLCICQVLFPCSINAKTVESDEFKIGFHFWKSGGIYEEAYQGIIDGMIQGGIKYTPFIFRSHPEKQQTLYRKMFPHLTRLGVIYDSDDPSGYLAEEPFLLGRTSIILDWCR